MLLQETKQTAAETTEQAKGKAGELAQRAEETKESAKGKAAEATKQAKRKAGELAGRAKDTKESAKETAAGAAEHAKGKAGELAQRVQETKESAKAKAGQAAQVMSSRLRLTLFTCSITLILIRPQENAYVVRQVASPHQWAVLLPRASALAVSCPTPVVINNFCFVAGYAQCCAMMAASSTVTQIIRTGNVRPVPLTARQVTKEGAAGMAQAARGKARQTINSTSRQLGHFEV